MLQDTVNFSVVEPRLVANLSVSNSSVDAGDVLEFHLVVQHSLQSRSYAADVNMTLNLDHVNTTDVESSLSCSPAGVATLQDGKLVGFLPLLSRQENDTGTFRGGPVMEFGCSFFGTMDNSVRPNEDVTFLLYVRYSSELSLHDDVTPLTLTARDTEVVSVHQLELVVEASPKHRPWSLRNISLGDYYVVAIGEPFDFSIKLILPESTTSLQIIVALLNCTALSTDCTAVEPPSNLSLSLLTHNVSVGQQLELLSLPDATVDVNQLGEIHINFGGIKNNYDNMAGIGDNLDISLRVNVSSLLHDQSLRLESKVIYELDSNRTGATSRYLDILVARPRLNITLERKTTAKERGDLLEYEVSLTHTHKSTLEAKDIVLVMTSSHPFLDSLNGSSYYYSSSSPHSITTLNNYDVIDKPLKFEKHDEEELVVLFSYTPKRNVRPNTMMVVNAAVTYGDRGETLQMYVSKHSTTQCNIPR